jgi:hypothetical protein
MYQPIIILEEGGTYMTDIPGDAYAGYLYT